MEPPTYEEASRHPPAQGSETRNQPPPPPYDNSLPSPPTPPPTYREAVTIQPDAFPVLTPPQVQTTVTSLNTGIIIHQHTQIGVTSPVSVGQTQPAVVVTQPQPVPVSLTYLSDIPAVVRCPHCQHTVTTKVRYLPGRAAWCMCILLSVMGLICGFCLIPFMVRGLQDAHHSCPRCENHLYTYTR